MSYIWQNSSHHSLGVFSGDSGGIHDVFAAESSAALFQVLALELDSLQLVDGGASLLGVSLRAGRATGTARCASRCAT